MIRLTIGIPTFNGAKTIEETIFSILDALDENNSGLVELLVSDNCSTDNTAEVVKNIADARNIDIKYYRNETNVGYDRNVDLVARRASGEYVWFMSDDDLVVNDGINKVLSVVDGVCDFCFANNGFAVSSTKRLLNGDDYFMECGGGGLISSCVVKKSSWLDSDLEKHIGQGWIHFAFIVDALSPKRGGLGSVAGDIVVKQNPHGQWKWGQGGSFISIGLNLLDIFSQMQNLGYRAKTQKKAYTIIKGWDPRNIVKAKAMGLEVSFPLMKRLIHHYHGFVSFYIIDLPCFMIPQPIAKMIVDFGLFLRKKGLAN